MLMKTGVVPQASAFHQTPGHPEVGEQPEWHPARGDDGQGRALQATRRACGVTEIAPGKADMGWCAANVRYWSNSGHHNCSPDNPFSQDHFSIAADHKKAMIFNRSARRVVAKVTVLK
jgi:hypothetical protein